MKPERMILGFIACFLLGCSPQDSSPPKVVEGARTELYRSSEPTPHYSVEPAELVDQTVAETHFQKPTYRQGNGTVLSYAESPGRKVWTRRFIDKIKVETANLLNTNALYAEPGQKTFVGFLKGGTWITSSEMTVVENDDKKSVDCWIKVVDADRKEGWLYLGSEDPYSSDNWAIIGSIKVEGKSLLLRKYTGRFDLWETQAATNAPSASGTVIWHPQPTDDNAQINFDALEVTDETHQGKYFPEHWVKVKDTYGRIGWLPGDSLGVERGGPKYLSPEAIVESKFHEP